MRVGSGPDFCKFRRVGSDQEMRIFLFSFFANCKILHGLKNCNVNSTFEVSGSGWVQIS
jgi:hypothetical protein